MESVAASDSGTNVSPASPKTSALLSGGSDGRTEEAARTRVSSPSSVYSGGSFVEGRFVGTWLDAGALAGGRSLVF